MRFFFDFFKWTQVNSSLILKRFWNYPYNGSPRAVFETTDDRLTFLVTIPVHEGCEDSSETATKSSGTKPKSSGTRKKTTDKIIEIIKKNQK